jgi:hypothetical protein
VIMRECSSIPADIGVCQDSSLELRAIPARFDDNDQPLCQNCLDRGYSKWTLRIHLSQGLVLKLN